MPEAKLWGYALRYIVNDHTRGVQVHSSTRLVRVSRDFLHFEGIATCHLHAHGMDSMGHTSLQVVRRGTAGYIEAPYNTTLPDGTEVILISYNNGTITMEKVAGVQVDGPTGYNVHMGNATGVQIGDDNVQNNQF